MSVIVLGSIAFVVMLLGLAGSFLPALPGLPLVFVAMFVFAALTGFDTISVPTIIVAGAVTGIFTAVHLAAGSIGAKQFGASTWGVVGALIGSVAGFFVGNIPGLLLGPFVGAVVAELLFDQNFQRSLKAGFGATLGLLGGTLMQIVASISLIILFLAALFVD